MSEPLGLASSSLAQIATSGLGDSRSSRTSGVLPTWERIPAALVIVVERRLPESGVAAPGRI